MKAGISSLIFGSMGRFYIIPSPYIQKNMSMNENKVLSYNIGFEWLAWNFWLDIEL